MSKKEQQLVKEKIDQLIRESFVGYQRDADLSTNSNTLLKLTEAWEFLPEPKSSWDESYLVSKYFTHVYVNANELQKANDYVQTFIECDNKQRGFGESEFMAGRIAFELNQLNEAKEYFEIATQKSDGRCWKTSDDVVKYYQFYKEK